MQVEALALHRANRTIERVSVGELELARTPTIPRCLTRWHTCRMPDNDDIKERMKQALEAKKGKAAKSTPHGQAPAEGKVHDQVDRAGGKREFRRKSGG